MIAFQCDGDVSSNVTQCSGTGWPSGAAIETTRDQEATPPVGGTFNITYFNATSTGTDWQ